MNPSDAHAARVGLVILVTFGAALLTLCVIGVTIFVLTGG